MKTTAHERLPRILPHFDQGVVDGALDFTCCVGFAALQPADRHEGRIDWEVLARGEIFEPQVGVPGEV
jgi:hypothetical protein